MKIIITGGAGFIGSALIRHLIKHTTHTVCNIDKLTYAGNLDSLSLVAESPRYSFYKMDICDNPSVRKLVSTFRPDAIMHLAAESHVDRSIENSTDFIETNIGGTFTLLNIARNYYQQLSDEGKAHFRFHHISTDEVYGDLTLDPGILFTEDSPYAPSSPYSASKAASDHLVRAWHRTYGLPTLITHCSNNYGPYQFPEKLIPKTIQNALSGKEIPIYGNGRQIRDWLYVNDHAKALRIVLENGNVGETYNIGGNNEIQNISVVNTICALLEELAPEQKPKGISSYTDLIRFVPDRPGHDQRYAIDSSKIQKELGWTPSETFESGLRKTVKKQLETSL